MIERIGKVILEDRLDGTSAVREPDATEKRLLEILTLHPAEEYSRLLAEQPTWPLIKQFSPLRENLMSWIPLEPGTRVLEIGAEQGAHSEIFGTISLRMEEVR